MAANGRHVFILQEYIPQYRVAFFDQLNDLLNAQGVSLTVLYGRPSRGLAARGDAARPTGNHYETLRQREWRFGGRRIVARWIPVIRLLRADLVVVEQARRNIDSYLLMLLRRRPTALWGHGGDYVVQRSGMTQRLYDWLTRRADRLFVYTRGGGIRAESIGVPNAKITVVLNATASITSSVHDSPGRSDVLFLGALDQSKNLELLWRQYSLTKGRFPNVKFHMVGEGCDDSEWRQLASADPAWVFHGRKTGEQLAEVAKGCRILFIPGRVGLVATDSFQLRIPILTTAWASHAPEFEYLEHGINALVARDEEHLSELFVAALSDDQLIGRLVQGCVMSSRLFSIDAFAARFANGVFASLGIQSTLAPVEQRVKGRKES